MPAVVVPASSAHFEGGELLLYAMARKGCTIWHRLARRPFLFLRRGGVLLSTRRGDGVLCAPSHAVDAMTLLTPSTRRGDGVFYATPRHRRHRRENAVDAGTGKARSFDLAGAALRLLALCDGNGYILARDARLVDYDDRGRAGLRRQRRGPRERRGHTYKEAARAAI